MMRFSILWSSANLFFLICFCLRKNLNGCDAFILPQRGVCSNTINQNLSSRLGGRRSISANLHDIHGLRRKGLFQSQAQYVNGNKPNDQSVVTMKLAVHLARQKSEGLSTSSSPSAVVQVGSISRPKMKKRHRVTKLFLTIGSTGAAYYTAGTMRRICAIISSTVIAHSIFMNFFTRPSSTTLEGDFKEIEKGGINDASAIWKDEERINKALKKSKRKHAWINQSLTSVEETDRRIADLKAKEAAEREAERKRKAKEWVDATMRSSRLAIEKAEQKRLLDEEKKRQAKKWAETLVRNSEVDLK